MAMKFVKKVNEIKPEIKIFLMTAFEIKDAEFRRVLPDVKIEDLLQKPVSLTHLINTISKHIPPRVEKRLG